MDDFSYLDQLANSAIEVERNFMNALIGSKDGAISQARSSRIAIGQMTGVSDTGFLTALRLRNDELLGICDSMISQSLSQASKISNQDVTMEANDIALHHRSFVYERLVSDGERKVAQLQLDMKRIAIIARSMRDDNDWDTSASLLRSRESVEKRKQLSTDANGKSQLTERFTKLLMRGLGVLCLADAVMAMSPTDSFEVVGFEGEVLTTIERGEYESVRDSLFHPQCRRYLRPLSK
ncbi:hypothetical protein R0J87_09265 [Halomonas sp. SIMBA_159]